MTRPGFPHTRRLRRRRERHGAGWLGLGFAAAVFGAVLLVFWSDLVRGVGL